MSMTPEQIREAAEAIAELRKSGKARRLTQQELFELRPRIRSLQEQQELNQIEQGKSLSCWFGSAKDR